MVLVGAAAFTAGGIGVRGRRSPFGPRLPLNGRTPESILSQAVGTLASPLMQYAKGGQSKITVTEPDGGRRTFFLIHDETSSHEAEIPVEVPPGGHMSVNPDGSVTVFDADGNPVSLIAAPWAYDANGNPVPTDYEVRDGRLIQKVYADEATAYPILADPPEDKIGMVDTTGRSDGETWTETLPGGQTATHTLVNAEAVDTRITREDGTWTDTRTNDDGQGNINTWSDDSWGAASYNNTDVTADESSTETWTTDSPTNGASPDAVSQANAANTEGSTVVANQDGTTSTADWAANDDGSYDSTITNPDQSNSYVHSGALDENNDNNTTVSNPDRTQSLLTADGELIQLNSDGSPESGVDPDGNSDTRWDSDAGQWVHNPTAEESAGYAAFVDAYGITPVTAEEWRQAAALGPYGESGGESPSEGGNYLDSLQASATAVATFGRARPSPAGAGLIIVGSVGLLGVLAFRAYQERNALGQYGVGNTGDGSKEAEQAGLDKVSEEEGVEVLRDQVLSKVPGVDNSRRYDGLFENEDGTYTGVEIKSGDSPYGGQQEAFDKAVSPDNPAVATLHGETIRIVDVIMKRVPRWTK
ncbi:hypothetical protein ABH922_005758 [Rhodococcus sp. 27YEA15]|uniref:hypothetical protein n=1 Tax=Rhodococcus sp. 27YEA15 TaxID=3156259 RepID=UPI003C7EAEF5